MKIQKLVKKTSIAITLASAVCAVSFANANIKAGISAGDQNLVSVSVWDLDPKATHTQDQNLWNKIDWSIFGPVNGSGWRVIGQKVNTTHGKTHNLDSMAVLGPTGHIAVHCVIKEIPVLASGVDQCEKLGGVIAKGLKQALKK